MTGLADTYDDVAMLLITDVQVADLLRRSDYE
jgi:hypothetical protein